MADKQILLIAFKFPPMGGVGTRRWAKFSKYLSKRGYTVHVITSDYPYTDKMNWLQDVSDNGNIIVHRVNAGYPFWVDKLPKNIFGRTVKRLWKDIVAVFFYYIDTAQQWERSLIPFAAKLVKDNQIRDVIITGSPVSPFYSGRLLKKYSPGINLIFDYRDPWNNHRSYELGKGLRFKWQKARSLQMEKEGLKSADNVVVVSSEMKKQMIDHFGLKPGKIHVIYNGYDKEDYEKVVRRRVESFNMIYAGSLPDGRNGRGNALDLLARAIKELNDECIDAMEINVFSNISAKAFEKSKNYDVIRRNFKFNGFVSPEEVLGQVTKHAFCLSINEERDAYAFGSKVFDYMGLGKKILHVSNGGELSEVLVRNGQYVSDYNIDNMKKALIAMKEDLKNQVSRQMSFSKFDISNLTTKYEALFTINNTNMEVK